MQSTGTNTRAIFGREKKLSKISSPLLLKRVQIWADFLPSLTICLSLSCTDPDLEP